MQDNQIIQNIASLLANDFVRGYRADKAEIKQSFVNLYEYAYTHQTGKDQVKVFADKVIENIPGYQFNYFMNALAIAEGFTLELTEYLRTEEANNPSKDETSEEKKEEKIKQIIQKKIAAHQKQLEIEEVGDYENNIIAKLADESVNESIEEDCFMPGGKGQCETYSQAFFKDIAEKIKKFQANLTTLKKSLKNIAAISSSIMNGIQKVPTGYGDVGYELGRDLRHVDARDLALLATPETEQLFKLKYAKGELLQETQKEGKGIGDLVIAIDTSGSVESEVGCEKYKATKTTILELEFAIAIAMSRFAIKSKAKVKIMLFDSNLYYTSDWLRSESNIKQFLQKTLVQELKTGGTDFDSPLTAMANLIKLNTHSKNKPGLVFITDGVDTVSPWVAVDVIASKKASGAKLYSYFLDDINPATRCPSLTEISDKYFWINTNEDIDSQIEKIAAIKS